MSTFPMHYVRRLPIALAGLLGAFLWTSSLSAQPSASAAERKAESRALAVVEAISSGDVDTAWSALRQNLQPSTLERRPESSWRVVLEQITEDLAGAEITGVSIDGAEIRVEARTDERFVTFSFQVESEAPYRLGGFSASLGEPPDDEAAGPELDPGMDRQEAVRAIGEFVDTHVAETGFSGTVLVARNGEVWYESAHGLAHRGYGVANHAGTRFDLGSINKVFTKVAVAQLAAAGELRLDDTVADLLPDYPNRDTAGKITVRHLAEHTSGLGDIFVPAYMNSPKTHFRRPEDFFPLFADEPLLFEPGEGRQYSNGGYQVLGAIVAAVSGMPYHDYVARKVWAPAGMNATAFIARDEPTPDVAVGYTTRTEDGRLRNNLFRLPVVGSPAGSSFSTCRDLLRFDVALRGGEIVPLAWAGWVLTGTEPGADTPQRDHPPLDHLGIGMAGGGPGVNAMYEINGAWTIVVLANQDPPIAGKLARPLSRAVSHLDPTDS